MKKSENKKKENYIYRNFKKSLSQLYLIKVYFLFSFFLFFLIAFLGFLFPIFFEEQILKIIENLIKQTQDLGVFSLIRFVISNNIQSAFFGFLSGIFLGVFPILILIINSYILGFVANKTVALEGVLVLWRLLPHGIFEIPAILISVALGLRIGFLLMYRGIKKYNKNINVSEMSFLMILSIIFLPISFIIYISVSLMNANLKKEFFKNFSDSFRIFIFIVVPLLVIAGIIEGILILLLS